MKKSNPQIQPSNSQSNLLNLLDFCKGLAIIGVFLIHYPSSQFNISYGWQGVHIFIVLSAFGLTYSRLNKNKTNSWRQWYIKRVEKILPSYWLIVLVGFLLMFIKYILKQENLIHSLSRLIARTITDVLLLRNFFVRLESGPPNPALWFVPFIISFYVIFPWLYNQIVKSKTAKDYILVLSVAASAEFIYRAISIYWFDSTPIAYNSNWIEFLPKLEGGQIAFGFVPSRIAEFVLGMIGGIIFVKNQQKFENFILNIWAAVAGLCIWLAGNALLYVGLWGWVFADFIIAIGIILFVINLALVFQQRFSSLFLGLSKLGIWSYYIYLTHYLVLFFTTQINKFTVDNDSTKLLIIQLLVFGFTIIATGIATWGLMQFDKSKFAKGIVQKLITGPIPLKSL